MKKQILAIALVGALGVTGVLAQGTIKFSNFEGSLAAPTLKALIYGAESDASVVLQGNPATGVPAGTTVYTGALLQGTGFTAQLWVGTTADNLTAAPGGAASMTSFRTGTAAGVITSKTLTLTEAPGTTVFFQIRAWDNRGGTITSWDQVLQDPTILRGQSLAVLSGKLGGTDAGGGINLTPVLTGLTSFNLHAVPEPSLVGLGILGGLGLFLIRRRS